MSHNAVFEAVGKTLKGIKGNNIIFGGVTFVMAGDFRQTLPVVPRGMRADEIRACVKSSYLLDVTKLGLSTYTRVHIQADEHAGIFSERLR